MEARQSEGPPEAGQSDEGPESFHEVAAASPRLSCLDSPEASRVAGRQLSGMAAFYLGHHPARLRPALRLVGEAGEEHLRPLRRAADGPGQHYAPDAYP